MGKVLLVIATMMLSGLAQANSIYKCIKDDKIVFSQTACPKDFRQHEIKYQLGITTETDSDKRKAPDDPLQALLNKRTISKEKLLQLIGSEIYRLNQENSYYDILRASEQQKLDRKRYWQKQDENDPEFVKQVTEMNQYFDELQQLNQHSIDLLKQHQSKIEAESADESETNETKDP